MPKRIPRSRKEKLSVVKITTEVLEHVCDDTCFHARRRPKPKGLRRMNMGYIHYSEDGRCYKEWGSGDWMEVTGITFALGPGGLHLLFEPKEQLYIHSRGGRTIERSTKTESVNVGPEYHVSEAAKKLKRAGKNLRQTREYLGSEAAKIIPRAPKKRELKGTGKGAPGVPRSDLGRLIVRLLDQGKSHSEITAAVTIWAKTKGKEIAGPHLAKMKRQISRWRQKKKVSK